MCIHPIHFTEAIYNLRGSGVNVGLPMFSLNWIKLSFTYKVVNVSKSLTLKLKEENHSKFEMAVNLFLPDNFSNYREEVEIVNIRYFRRCWHRTWCGGTGTKGICDISECVTMNDAWMMVCHLAPSAISCDALTLALTLWFLECFFFCSKSYLVYVYRSDEMKCNVVTYD